jgi:PilZ domain-containing protein
MKTYTRQRASPRFRPKPGTHIVYLEGFGEIRDVSLHGVFVLGSHPLPVGTKLKFSFRFGSDDIPVQGIVQRSVDGQGMGIELIETSSEARNRLKFHLVNLL